MAYFLLMYFHHSLVLWLIANRFYDIFVHGVCLHIFLCLQGFNPCGHCLFYCSISQSFQQKCILGDSMNLMSVCQTTFIPGIIFAGFVTTVLVFVDDELFEMADTTSDMGLIGT